MTAAIFGASSGAYKAPRSLDFERDSSSHLQMSGANFGYSSFDSAKMAYAASFKRESTGGSHCLLNMAGGGAAGYGLEISIQSDRINIQAVSGGVLIGQLVTTATYTSTSAFYNLLFYYDSANPTPGDRMRLFIDGVEVTAFNTDIQPSSAFQKDNGGNIRQGGRLSGVDFFDGLIFRPAFWSGVLPSAASVYSGGSYQDVSSTAGLFSYLKTNAVDSLTDDSVIVADWTNSGVVKSTDVP